MCRYAIPIIVFAGLAVLFLRGLDRNPGYVESPFIGKPAPAFELPQLKDPSQTVSNATFAGKTALLNVWATWCVGCRQEHEFLLQLSRERVIPIYGINYKDDSAKALAFLAELGDPYVAIGADKTGRTAIDWGVYGVPETFVIDGDGVVRLRFAGPVTGVILEKRIRPVLEAASGGE